MNYAALVSAIKAYTENDFPDTVGSGGLTSTAQINVFIQQAEQRIFNMVQLLDLRKSVTGSLTSGNKYLSVPSDWLANFSLAVIDASGNYSYLLNKDVNFIRESFPNASTTGLPTHYAYFDETSYILGPTPDSAYAVELHYFYYPPSIVTAGTSWLGDNFDSALLYGSLLEAYTFMKGELKQLGEGKNRQDMYRTAQARYPVQ
jgi:hypothetical protein